MAKAQPHNLLGVPCFVAVEPMPHLLMQTNAAIVLLARLSQYEELFAVLPTMEVFDRERFGRLLDELSTDSVCLAQYEAACLHVTLPITTGVIRLGEIICNHTCETNPRY